MKVLMTGSHGFVGTNLVEAFESSYQIIRWNVWEDKPLPECDVVIHLAGLAHDTNHTTELKEYFRVNTDLTKKMYDRFLESLAKKFIFLVPSKLRMGIFPMQRVIRLLRITSYLNRMIKSKFIF